MTQIAAGRPPVRKSVLIGQVPGLGEELGDSPGLDQFARLVEVIVHDRLGIDPEGVINRSQQFAWVHRILDRRRGGAVRFAMDITTLDTAPGDAGGVAVWPVITSVGIISITGSTDTL